MIYSQHACIIHWKKSEKALLNWNRWAEISKGGSHWSYTNRSGT